MNRIEEIEKKHLEQVSAGKKITEFFPGDTIKVGVIKDKVAQSIN